MSITLYFMPGACSFSVHTALRESGMDFTLERVGRDKMTTGGIDFRTINPKGSVHCLKLENGDTLTVCTAILQYVADHAPNKTLAPAFGTFERYRMLETLNFIATELHKGIGALFNPAAPADFKAALKDGVMTKLGMVDRMLEGKQFILGGENFSIADAYLNTVLSWTNFLGIDVSGLSNVSGYMARMAERPSVQAARAAERA